VRDGQVLRVDLSANGNCPKTVNIAVYTAAYRKIFEQTKLITGRQSWTWNLVDTKGALVASGVYYVRVEEVGVGTVLKWSPVVVLR